MNKYISWLFVSFICFNICSAGILSDTLPGNWSVNKQYNTPEGPIWWQTYVPLNITNKVPLIIWLHGGVKSWGVPDIKPMNDFFISNIRKNPCYILVPCALDNKNWVSETGEYVKNDIPSRPTTSVKAVMHLLNEVLNDCPIDTNRVYIGGASGGGYGTFAFIQAYPEMFSAAFPIASNGRTDLVDELCDIRIWMFHGRNDRIVPVKFPKKMFTAMMYSCNTDISFGYTPWEIDYVAGNKRLTIFTFDGHAANYEYIFTPEFMEWLFK